MQTYNHMLIINFPKMNDGCILMFSLKSQGKSAAKATEHLVKLQNYTKNTTTQRVSKRLTVANLNVRIKWKKINYKTHFKTEKNKTTTSC